MKQEKMALHHIGQQTVGASMLIVTPYEEKSYLLMNLFIYSMNECKWIYSIFTVELSYLTVECTFIFQNSILPTTQK